MATKANIYITKDEAIKAMRSGRTREESEWAIRSVKATKVKRSMKIAPTYYKRGEEYCPHCRKGVEVYCLSASIPRYCYCFWCGGALDRGKGLKRNPVFDYKLVGIEDKKNEDD